MKLRRRRRLLLLDELLLLTVDCRTESRRSSEVVVVGDGRGKDELPMDRRGKMVKERRSWLSLILLLVRVLLLDLSFHRSSPCLLHRTLL